MPPGLAHRINVATCRAGANFGGRQFYAFFNSFLCRPTLSRAPAARQAAGLFSAPFYPGGMALYSAIFSACSTAICSFNTLDS
jgi:hypothetical protein